MYHTNESMPFEPTPVPQQKSAEVGVESSIDQPVSLIERLKAFAESRGLNTTLDELKKLHESGNTEDFDQGVEDVAFELLENDPEFIDNIEQLKKIRLRGDLEAETKIRSRQKSLLDEAKVNILNEAGLSGYETSSEFNTAKTNIAERIKTFLENGGSQEDILKELGIIKLDANDKERFEYPQGLFPEQTDTKWGVYLQKVAEHIRSSRSAESGVGSRHESEQADHIRRLAHNAVTRDVHELLGFDALEEGSWDFQQTRRLLAKMRDHQFPTIETGEKFRTTDQIMKAAAALGMLARKNSENKK